jgi:hypothetical protein
VERNNLERALLFKNLATLRIDAPLFDDVEQLRWRGATRSFLSVAKKIDDEGLAKRVGDLAKTPIVTSSV